MASISLPRIFICLSCLLSIIFSTAQSLPTNYIPKTTTFIPKSLPVATNVIDACRRRSPNWAKNRQALADCAIGFGKDALGGKDGRIYTVTSNEDDAQNPKPGTLRYGAIQDKPLWIIFARDMVIRLESELMVNNYKTIDGRGARVEIAHGPCITIQGVKHVIVHGISIHDCTPGKYGMVRSTPTHVGTRLGSEGDAITVFQSSHVWIDHCSLARSADGLIDVVYASTAVTITNNYFSDHDTVMLLGHNDNFTPDKIMKVTIAFNRFGTGLTQRMPRYILLTGNETYKVRFGYAHVANNQYDEWQKYAIGGSADPTIFSEGNYFAASSNSYTKEVTKREIEAGWKDWKWRSSKDVFKNGAFFVPSGWGSCYPFYTPRQDFKVLAGALTPSLTAAAGILHCVVGKEC